MRAHGLTESLVVGKACLVEGLEIQRHESFALLVGDLQMTMDIDDALKAQFAGEPIGSSERFRSEPRQVIDVVRSALGEHVFQDRIREDLLVEHLLEAMKGLIPDRMLVS